MYIPRLSTDTKVLFYILHLLISDCYEEAMKFEKHCSGSESEDIQENKRLVKRKIFEDFVVEESDSELPSPLPPPPLILKKLCKNSENDYMPTLSLCPIQQKKISESNQDTEEINNEHSSSSTCK